MSFYLRRIKIDWLIDWLLMGQTGLILGVLYQLYSLTCTQVLNQINWVYNFLSTSLTIFMSIHILESCREKQSPVSLQVKWESAVRPLFTHVHVLRELWCSWVLRFWIKDLIWIWFDLIWKNNTLTKCRFKPQSPSP